MNLCSRASVPVELKRRKERDSLLNMGLPSLAWLQAISLPVAGTVLHTACHPLSSTELWRWAILPSALGTIWLEGLPEGWFAYFFFFSSGTACRILVPQPGIELGPQAWKLWVLTTGPPGTCLLFPSAFLLLLLLLSCFSRVWLCATPQTAAH